LAQLTPLIVYLVESETLRNPVSRFAAATMQTPIKGSSAIPSLILIFLVEFDSK
jgi:hypothetical protein